MLRRRLPSLCHALTVLSLAVFISSPAASLPVKAQTTSGTLLGIVRDKGGKGQSETKITLENEENGNLRATRTDDNGNYAIFNLPPGTYKVTASKQGFRDQTIKSFPVQFNQKNVVKLPLFTLVTATLRGTVVDPAGKAVSGARVIVVGQSDNVTRETVTSKDGGYTISDLALGNYALTALWADGRREMVGTFPIPLSEQTADSKFVAVLFPRRTPDNRKLSLAAQSPDRGRTRPTETPELRRVSLADTPAVRRVVPTVPGQMTVAPHQAADQPSDTSTQQTSASTPTYQDGSNAASLLNTTDAARSRNFSERQINALPVGGANAMRSFDELALLVPGVAPPPYTPGVRGPGVGFGIGTAGQFSVNGMRARANNFSVDGSDNNDPDVGVRRQGFVALVPQSLESVKEISISTLLWDAELGRNFGGQINAVSKYGGNSYHGQLYAFFTDSRLNARNFFDTAGRTPFTRTQLGLTLGGPIVRNRTQFFFSFERQKTNTSIIQHFAVPATSERTLLGRSGFNVLHSAFPNTTLSHSGVMQAPLGATGLGGTLLSYYPLPNDSRGPYGSNNYTEILPADSKGLVSSLRVTHQVSSHTLNARYNFTDDNRTVPTINRALRSTMGSATRSHNVSLILDSQLTNTLFNQARFSFGRTRLNFSERPDSPFLLPEKFAGDGVVGDCFYDPMLFCTFGALRPELAGLGELVVEPYSPIGINAYSFPQRRVSNTFQFADSISWQKRSHSLKFGANVRHVQLNSSEDRLYRPQVVFGYGSAQFGDLGALNTGVCCPQFTPQGAPALLTGVQLAALGLPSSIFQTIATTPAGSGIGLRQTEFQLFANDNWRVRPNLTIDYGLRYEYATVPREGNNIIEDAITLRNLPAPGPSVYNTNDRTVAYDNAVGALRQVLDGRTRIYDPDRNNFGPHFGFAWDPRSDGAMTVRGGYGIYYDAVLGAVVSQSRNVFPNHIPVNIDPTFFDSVNLITLDIPAFIIVRDPPGLFAGHVPLVQSTLTNRISGGPQDLVALLGYLFERNQEGAGLAFTLPAKKLATPYAQQWHLTLERQLYGDYVASAAYVGTKGTKLTRLTTPNRGPTITPVIPIASTRFGNPITSVFGNRDPLVIADLVPQFTSIFARRGRRPMPNLGAFQIFENSANSNYHALQLEARKRYSHDFQFTAAYTWSHAIDDVSDVFPIAGTSILPQDTFNLRLERGNANFDVRHRFAASLLWDLPFYRNSNGRLGRVLRDWQISSIVQAHTGQPFTLTLPLDANLDGNLSDRPSTADGINFVRGNGPQRVAIAAGRQLTDFFTFGRDGAIGRNTVRGDSFISVDVALSKNFRFSERQDLTFRTEFFNLLNHPNFGLPIRTIGAPGFGSAVDTAGPARTIVLVVKSRF